MLNTTLTALLTALFVVVFLTAGAAIYAVAGLPGMSAMHNAALAEYQTDGVGSPWNMHRATKTRPDAATPAR